MIPQSTRPAPRLRCRKCGSKNIHPSAIKGRTRKPHHNPDVAVICRDCDHIWWSKSRAAQFISVDAFEAAGQGVIAWDEAPLRKNLTRPPLPD